MTGKPSWTKYAHNPQVVAAAPYVDGQGMLSFGQSVQGVMVRGIDPAKETAITDLANKMKAGSLEDLRSGRIRHRAGRRPGTRARRAAGRQRSC